MTDETPGRSRRPAPDGGRPDEQRVLVLNPVSGDGDHADRVQRLAADHGFEIRKTRGEGDAARFAREAADDADLVAAAGGDGTLNEVVRGLVEADALDDVTFGVVPAGTGNNFAGNIGVRDVDHAFTVIEEGDRRVIDLAFADGRPVLNSCVGGLTADASAETDPEMKSNLGVMAYVVTTFQTALEYDGVTMDIETAPDHGEGWQGEAVMVLVGNGRRFPSRGGTQANMEDGLLDVTIVEEPPTFDLASLAKSAALERLLGMDAENVVRLKTPALAVAVRDEGTTTFSLDGEMTETAELTVETEPGALALPVGDSYAPDPEPDAETRF